VIFDFAQKPRPPLFLPLHPPRYKSYNGWLRYEKHPRAVKAE
jgi:hypothetical protein